MCSISPGIMSVSTGGQICSIIFMPGDIPHMHSLARAVPRSLEVGGQDIGNGEKCAN